MSAKNQIIFWGMAMLAFLLFVYIFSSVLTPFVVGFALAYFLNPAVNEFTKAGINRTGAGLIILGGFTLFLAVLIGFSMPVIIQQAQDLSANLPQYASKIMVYIQEFSVRAHDFIGYQGPAFNLQSVLSEHTGTGLNAAKYIAGGVAAGGKAVVGAVMTIILAPVVAFFMIREWPALERWVESLMPRNHKNTILDLLKQIDKKLSGFVRGQISVAFILGIVYALALSAAGLDYSVLIGVGAGVLSVIPMVGSVSGLIIGVLVAWFQTGQWEFVLLIAGIFLVGQFIEGNFLTPRIMGDRVGLHPLWIFFALMAGGSIFGILGILLAVPVAAVIGVLGSFAIAQYKASAFYKKTPVKNQVKNQLKNNKAK